MIDKGLATYLNMVPGIRNYVEEVIYNYPSAILKGPFFIYNAMHLLL